MTTHDHPWGIDTARHIVQNNPTVKLTALIRLETDVTWLPHALVEAGFFPSGSEVKRNRKDLWRDLVSGETIKLKWAEVTCASQ